MQCCLIVSRVINAAFWCITVLFCLAIGVALKYKLFLSSNSYSVFIRYCLLSRDDRIHSIPSAIARTPSLHFARFRASSFRPIFSISSSKSSAVPAFSCHSLQDPEQPSKHYRHFSSAHVHTILLDSLLLTGL